MGINVAVYRYAHTLVGGAFAGVAGATFSLAITPQWVDGLTQGAGWIAIALVIFAFLAARALPNRPHTSSAPSRPCRSRSRPRAC
jgi:ABC-type uncharacterized transport system permease subunit